MRRVTEHEIAFYDHVADRISRILGDISCPQTQSSLAKRIGWNRASLCNFLNRIDKTIAAHFIPRIAQVLHLTIAELMDGEVPAATARKLWDPRSDEAEHFVKQFLEFLGWKTATVSLRRTLPEWILPTRAMLVNYIDSIFDGGSATAAERWHEMIDTIRPAMCGGGEAEALHIIPVDDLQRLVNRTSPYQGFSRDEVVCLLDHVKSEWVRHRDFRFVMIEQAALTPDAKLELAGNISLTAFGREARMEHRQDLRIYWDHHPGAVAFTRDCLLRLKRAAGLGTQDRPSERQVEQTLDDLLLKVDAARPAITPLTIASLPRPVQRSARQSMLAASARRLQTRV